ncbi:MAG TPA: HDOD domain-containing protein [Jatrophihabitans sp.]|nr:HDOD domain-containing protein [Jatrophihabitans sp.]
MSSIATDRVIVGRQSIRDAGSAVVGYVLLTAAADPQFRDEDAPGLPPAAVGGNLDALVGDRRLFWPLPADGSDEPPAPPARTVLTVGEDINDDPAVVTRCVELAGAGYGIALTGLPWAAPDAALTAAASIAEIDTGAHPAAELPALVERLRRPGLQLLATGLDTPDALATARELGFDLFRGAAVERLPCEQRREPGPSELARARMSATLLQNPLDFDEIEDMLRTEPGLTYQVIELASIGRLGDTARQVTSLRRALVLVGSWRIQNWMVMLLAQPQAERTDGAMSGALARARACELLTAGLGRNEARLGFTAGMISSFEQLTQVPRDELVQTLALSAELRDAAFGGESELGRVVADVAARQEGADGEVGRSGRPVAAIEAALAAGYEWALRASAVLA